MLNNVKGVPDNQIEIVAKSILRLAPTSQRHFANGEAR